MIHALHPPLYYDPGYAAPTDAYRAIPRRRPWTSTSDGSAFGLATRSWSTRSRSSCWRPIPPGRCRCAIPTMPPRSPWFGSETFGFFWSATPSDPKKSGCCSTIRPISMPMSSRSDITEATRAARRRFSTRCIRHWRSSPWARGINTGIRRRRGTMRVHRGARGAGPAHGPRRHDRGPHRWAANVCGGRRRDLGNTLPAAIAQIADVAPGQVCTAS